jgi:hypothetical protein
LAVTTIALPALLFVSEKVFDAALFVVSRVTLPAGGGAIYGEKYVGMIGWIRPSLLI